VFFRGMHGPRVGLWVWILGLAAGRAVEWDWWVFWGTYTGGGSRGIYVSRFDGIRGRLTPPHLCAELPHPSFLSLARNGRFLYAVSETGDGRGSGGQVAGFAVDDRAGSLRPLGQRSSGGDGPCHVSTDARGRWLFVANYGSGSVAVLPVDRQGRPGDPRQVIRHTGSGVHPERQRGPHAHQSLPSPEGRYVLVCDLGLDQVRVYRWRLWRGALEEAPVSVLATAPGSGPRHLSFHPNGPYAYVVNELDSTLTACRWDGRSGRLDALQTLSTLPPGVDPSTNTTAEVAVHPSGKWVYVSNRGHDSIAMFRVDPESGRIGLLGQENTRGRRPRHFALDPDGRWCLVAHQDSDTVVVFRVDARTGRLLYTGHSIRVPSPVCAVFARVNDR